MIFGTMKRPSQQFVQYLYQRKRFSNRASGPRSNGLANQKSRRFLLLNYHSGFRGKKEKIIFLVTDFHEFLTLTSKASCTNSSSIVSNLVFHETYFKYSFIRHNSELVYDSSNTENA